MADTAGGFLLETAGEWIDPNGDPWIVELEWAELDGRAECVGIKLTSARLWGEDRQVGGVRSNTSPRPITAQVWRSFAPAAFLADERRSFTEPLDVVVGLEGRTVAEHTGAPEAFTRRRLSAEQLETTVAAYNDAWRAGAPTGEAVRAAFAATGDYISVSTARNRIEAARRKRLLPTTVKGRARGGPVDA
jgi:hypothetical protein